MIYAIQETSTSGHALLSMGRHQWTQYKWVVIKVHQAPARNSLFTIHKLCSIAVDPLITNHLATRATAILSVIHRGSDVPGDTIGKVWWVGALQHNSK